MGFDKTNVCTLYPPTNFPVPSGTVNQKVRVRKAQGNVSELAVKVNWWRQDVLCIGGGLILRLVTDSQLF